MKSTVAFLMCLGAFAFGHFVESPEAQACGTCRSRDGGEVCEENWVSAYNCIMYFTIPPQCQQTSSCVES